MTEQQLTPSSAAQWRAIGQYTAAQAASLMLGLEPQGERIKDASPKVQALAGRIAERFNLRDPGPVIKRRGDPAPSQRTTISLADVERFAYAAELTDSPLFHQRPQGLDMRTERVYRAILAALLTASDERDEASADKAIDDAYLAIINRLTEGNTHSLTKQVDILLAQINALDGAHKAGKTAIREALERAKASR